MKVQIEHWRYDDGWQMLPPFLVSWVVERGGIVDEGGREYHAELVGWHCWAYPSNDKEFDSWMRLYCPTADWQHRFNGGDCMWTVHIKDEKEAMMFRLKWVNCA